MNTYTPVTLKSLGIMCRIHIIQDSYTVFVNTIHIVRDFSVTGMYVFIHIIHTIRIMCNEYICTCDAEISRCNVYATYYTGFIHSIYRYHTRYTGFYSVVASATRAIHHMYHEITSKNTWHLNPSYTFIYSHIHIHTHSYTHKFIYTQIHIHTHSCTHTFTYTHIHIHTHAYTLVPSLKSATIGCSKRVVANMTHK